MRPDRKTLYLFFLCLCMLVSLLYAEPPFDDDFFFQAPTLLIEAAKFQIRSFDAVFPGFSREQKATAMGGIGIRNFFVRGESPTLVPNPDSGIDLLERVMEKDPSHLIEGLLVVPYNGQESDLLEVYNAVGRIEDIKNYSTRVNGRDFYAITESTRIESARNRRDIPDPPPAVRLPFSQTMYLRIKDVDFGNLFLRADLSISLYGMTYRMTNFADIRFFLIPVMRAERFNTVIYLEPVEEGILIYCVCGFYMPGFIANMINLTSTINTRVTILTNWVIDSLRKQGSAATSTKSNP